MSEHPAMQFSNVGATRGRLSALGQRAVNSFFWRTGLRRPGPATPAAAPRWVRVASGPLAGGWLFLDTDSSAYWEREMAEGRFDPFIYEALKQWGGIEGATCWDVGAHIGYHSLCFAALVGARGRVVSFEPNPYNVERFHLHLERNPDLASRITLLTAALSDADGEAMFEFSPTVDDGTSTGSHLAAASAACDPSEYANFAHTTVKTLRADTLLREGRISPPTVIKLDVEGAEQLVLEGASELLTSLRPLLFVEVHNISQMFYVQKLLLGVQYTMEILDAEHASLSRCFVIARP